MKEEYKDQELESTPRPPLPRVKFVKFVHSGRTSKRGRRTHLPPSEPSYLFYVSGEN